MPAKIADVCGLQRLLRPPSCPARLVALAEVSEHLTIALGELPQHLEGCDSRIIQINPPLFSVSSGSLLQSPRCASHRDGKDAIKRRFEYRNQFRRTCRYDSEGPEFWPRLRSSAITNSELKAPATPAHRSCCAASLPSYYFRMPV